jgi:hypothetical protein
MRNQFKSVSVAIVCFLIIAVCLLINAPVFAQGPDGSPAPSQPQPSYAPVPYAPSVAAAPGGPAQHFAVPTPLGRAASLLKQYEALKENLCRFAWDMAVNLLSGNEAHLLSENCPKLLSENNPKLLSDNKAQLLSGNQTRIFSNNHLSFFSDLKIEIHIENTGNNSGNHPSGPNMPPEKRATF